MVPHYYSEIPRFFEQFDDFKVTEFLGDTLLRSANWLAGSACVYTTLYDACIVRVQCGEQCAVVPAAQVLFSTLHLPTPEYERLSHATEMQREQEEDGGEIEERSTGYGFFLRGTRNDGFVE